MNLAEKLRWLMQRDGIKTTAELSRILDIPYKTLDNIMHRDTFDNVKFTILKKICIYFKVDLRYLCFDEITNPNPDSACNVPLAAREQALIDSYRKLNRQGQAYIDQTIEMALQNSAFTDTGQRSAQIS